MVVPAEAFAVVITVPVTSGRVITRSAVGSVAKRTVSFASAVATTLNAKMQRQNCKNPSIGIYSYTVNTKMINI